MPAIKAFPIVRRLDGLFHKLWEKGVRGTLLRVFSCTIFIKVPNVSV
jgi:hypothetical protein